MGGRYIITGAQIGLLMSEEDTMKRRHILEQIQEDQFIGKTDELLELDVEFLQNLSIWKN